jgi:hypothetical protein
MIKEFLFRNIDIPIFIKRGGRREGDTEQRKEVRGQGCKKFIFGPMK